MFILDNLANLVPLRAFRRPVGSLKKGPQSDIYCRIRVHTSESVG